MAMDAIDEEMSIHHDRLLAVQKLSESRFDKDLRCFLTSVEQAYSLQVSREEQDRRARAQQDHYLAVQAEKIQELERRLFQPARDRQLSSYLERERIKESMEEEMARKERTQAERWVEFQRNKADEVYLRSVEAETREAHGRMALARAKAMELERAAEEARRQEMIAQKRAEVLAAIAEGQARQADHKRQRDEAIQAQVRANEQRLADERAEKEERFDAKIARVNRMTERRDEVLQWASISREEMHSIREELSDMLVTAKRTCHWDPLLGRLQAMGLSPGGLLGTEGPRTPRPPSAPATPRARRPPSARLRQANKTQGRAATTDSIPAANKATPPPSDFRPRFAGGAGARAALALAAER